MIKRKRNSALATTALLFAGAFVGPACDRDVDLGGDPAADSGEAGAPTAGVAGSGGSATAGAPGKGGAAGATTGAGGVAGTPGGSAGQGIAGGLVSACEPDAMGEVRFTVEELCSHLECPQTVAEALASVSELCDDGLVEVTLCNGVRSVVLNGGFSFDAYAFDAETEELIGVVRAGDVPFGPCDLFNYTAGIGWNRCDEAQSCDCSECPSCGGEGGEGGVGGASGAGGVPAAEAVAGPCIP